MRGKSRYSELKASDSSISEFIAVANESLMFLVKFHLMSARRVMLKFLSQVMSVIRSFFVIIVDDSGKDPRLVEAILNESNEVVRIGPNFIITETKQKKAIGKKLLDDAFIRENGIKREKTNLGNIVADTAKKLVFYANNNGVNVVVDAKTVEADCDPLLVEMLLTNLANNAIKACKGNGRIILSCGIRDGSPYLSVNDNGVGMTAEQLTRITEPFYRTDKSRARNDGGTGLGLALCDRIAAGRARLHLSS